MLLHFCIKSTVAVVVVVVVVTQNKRSCGHPRQPESLPGDQFLVKEKVWLPMEKNYGQPSQQ